MTDDFLAAITGNPVRARLLRFFLFNPAELFSPIATAKRAAISQKVFDKEVRALEKIGVVKKKSVKVTPEGKKAKDQRPETMWCLNLSFKYRDALSKFVHEVSPMQYENIMTALRRSGRLVTVILSGHFLGDPSRPADIIVAADALNESRLEQAVKGLEPALGREIRYAAFSAPEFRYRLTIQDRLIRDTLDYPHLVLLDRTRMLL